PVSVAEKSRLLPVKVPLIAFAVMVLGVESLLLREFACTANAPEVGPAIEMCVLANRSIQDSPLLSVAELLRSALIFPELVIVMLSAQTSMQAVELLGLPGRNVLSQ